MSFRPTSSRISTFQSSGDNLIMSSIMRLRAAFARQEFIGKWWSILIFFKKGKFYGVYMRE